MTAYYVRASMGNDGNTGLSPAQAFLTIQQAVDTATTPGDEIAIGSGVYPELVTIGTNGTSGNLISFIGDIDGLLTGDPGPVVITAHDALTGASIRAGCIDINDGEFLFFSFLILVGGTAGCITEAGSTANQAYEEVTFEDCTFVSGSDDADSALVLDCSQGATPTTAGLIMRRCSILGMFLVFHTTNAVAHVNLKWTIEDCVFMAHQSGDNRCFAMISSDAQAYSVGGIDIVNCTFWGGGGNGCIQPDDLENTTDPFTVYNCRFIYSQYAIYGLNCAASTVLEDYNLGVGLVAGTAGTVTAGGNSDWVTSGPVMGGIADLMFYTKLGWSPWKPWEPMSLIDGTALDPCIGFASASYAPATDMYGNPRPMKRSAADDVGAVEARARLEPETGTVRTDTYSGALKGAGYHDVMLPVTAAATTVSVYGRYDANYTGSLPILEVLEIPGVVDQSDVMTGASGNWEQISCTFTPTSAGYVRVRVRSQDTSADGECYFDDMVIS